MSESKAKKIEIKDVDGQTLSKLIDYIYTAEIEVTEENVQVISATGSCATHSSPCHFSILPSNPYSSSEVTTEETKLQRIKLLYLAHMASPWACWS